MNEIARKLKRPSKTVLDHVHNHNNAIARSGFCPICRRVRSNLESHEAKISV
jgi:hypothetical protein